MSSNLAILRHGITDWNLEGKIQGRTDIPLNENGKNTLSSLTVPSLFQKVQWITSPLRRARETAKILDLEETRTDIRLIEMNWGEWEGKKLKDLRGQHAVSMSENENRGLDMQPPGGETPRDVQDRLKPLLQEIGKSNKTVGAVSHKGVIRALLCLATGWNMLGKPPVKIDWGCIQIFSLDASGSPSLYKANLPLEKRYM